MQFLAIIALFASSAMAAGIATAEISIKTTEAGGKLYLAPVGECIATPEVKLKGISGLIARPFDAAELKCTVYSEDDCTGDEWEVTAGKLISIPDAFSIASLKCEV